MSKQDRALPCLRQITMNRCPHDWSSAKSRDRRPVPLIEFSPRRPDPTVLPGRTTDRPTSTLGPLDTTMVGAPHRIGLRQVPLTAFGLGNYRPTNPPVPSTLWIPPWPRLRGWHANSDTAKRAPL